MHDIQVINFIFVWVAAMLSKFGDPVKALDAVERMANEVIEKHNKAVHKARIGGYYIIDTHGMFDNQVVFLNYLDRKRLYSQVETHDLKLAFNVAENKEVLSDPRIRAANRLISRNYDRLDDPRYNHDGVMQTINRLEARRDRLVEEIKAGN